MSKSLGNVLDPFEVMDRFGTDALRYYCFREVSFGQDGGVSTVTFGERYEAELANELGNLASRTLSMISRYRDGVVPDVEADPALRADFEGLTGDVCELLDRAEITQALDVIWERVRRLNAYVAETEPWKLAKDPDRGAELDRALASVIEGLRVVAVLLAPYVPDSVEKLRQGLGGPELSYDAASYGARRLERVEDGGRRFGVGSVVEGEDRAPAGGDTLERPEALPARDHSPLLAESGHAPRALRPARAARPLATAARAARPPRPARDRTRTGRAERRVT